MRAWAFILAVLLGVFLAAGQCGSGADDDDGDRASSSADDTKDDHPSDEDTDHGSDSDSDSDDDSDDPGGGSDRADAVQQRLEEAGLHVEQRSTSSEDDCAAHAYGEVRDWFQDHPCRSVDRAWYEVRDDDDTAVLSVGWVEMSDAERARALRQEVDGPGSGNVTELSRDDGPYREVRYSGRHYESDVDGDTVVNVQAEPVDDSAGADEVARRSVDAAVG